MDKAAQILASRLAAVAGSELVAVQAAVAVADPKHWRSLATKLVPALVDAAYSASIAAADTAGSAC